MSNNPIELLVMLGLDNHNSARNLKQQLKNFEKHNLGNLEVALSLNKQSLVNIQQHIKSIQSNINDLDVGLNIKGSPSDSKVFESMNRQINALQSKIKELEGGLLKVGKSNSSSSLFGEMNDDVNKTLKSVDQLQDEIQRMNGSLKIVNDESTGKIKEVVATIERELGKIEQRVYRPTVDVKIGDNNKLSFAEETSVTNDKNYNNLAKRINEARNQLEELGRVGKLTNAQFNQFDSLLSQIKTNPALDEVLSDLKKVNKEMSHNVKWNNAENNIKQQADVAIESINRLKNSFTGMNVDTSQLDALLNKFKAIKDVKIDTDVKMNDTSGQFLQLNKELSSLKNNSASFETAFKGVNDVLLKAERQGLMSADELDKLNREITMLATSKDIPIVDKLTQLKSKLDDVNRTLSEVKHTNKMAEETRKAANEVERLESMLTKTENSYKRTVNKNDVADARGKLGNMAEVPAFTNVEQVKAYKQELKQIENQIKRINSEATVGARNSMGIIDSLKIALERFPIWMLSSTLFFGTVRGIKSVTDNVIQLDSAMVNLTRVTEAFQFEFDEVISRSIENVKALSGNLSEYLELVNEYARTGKSLEESYELANTTQMLVNISDLNAKESMDSITAALISYNMEASESVRIADKLNEVDNNFSVTSKILSDGMLKASATASTFGVSLDELLGHITAISSSTRESGAIVGNSLKSIYARITTNDSAISALDAIGISMNKLDGTAKNSSELISEVASKWDSLTESQQRQTSVGVAGIYQLSR